MQDFIETASLGLNHVQMIVQAMYAVAKSDDVHPVEQVLIREFYESCRHEADGIADYGDLVNRPFDLDEAATVLNTRDLRKILLKSCFFLAFADGEYSAAEDEVITSFAEHFGFSKPDLEDLKAEVTDYLLQQIARIQNTDALREVASDLWKR